MKIVLPDAQTVTKNDLNLDMLKEFGEVKVYNLTSYDEISQRVKDADAVICNKTPLNRDTLKYADNLKYIGLFATGYNNIDIKYCKEKSITVCNAGSYSENAVAQHTFALILEFYNKVGEYNSFVQMGNWQDSPTFSPFVFPLNELAGKTIGIIGFGSIGRQVSKIAKAFNMNVMAYNRSPKSCDEVTFSDFDTVLKNSDIISVHCPLNEQSMEMFNKETFLKMKKGALFVNTARGGVLVEQDLFDALSSGHLGGAAIDVLTAEPMPKDCVLLKAPNCIITPHIAWAPIETRERLMYIVADNLRNFLKGTPSNAVV